MNSPTSVKAGDEVQIGSCTYIAGAEIKIGDFVGIAVADGKVYPMVANDGVDPPTIVTVPST